MDTDSPNLSDESIRALADALRPLIREEVERAVGSTTTGAGARLEELLGRAEQTARGLAGSLGTDASALKDEATKRGRDAVDSAAVQVQENPVVALLMALGFGFILGVIFGPGRR